MSVSKLLPAGGANDFNLNITGATTVADFDKEYASGSYSVVSSGNDTTLDIYAYSAGGVLVGYSATKAFTATGGFNKMVIVGGTNGDVLGFTYKKTITTTTSTADVTAGAVIYSITPSVAAKQNDTVTITGANFATDVTVTFTGTGYSATAAKAISRTNSTTLVVTRPDNFPTTGSPYTITVSNPGVTNPVGSNAHILANCITAGNSPVWSTGATLPTYSRNVSYSTTLVATDSSDAGSTITYSVVSGSLPTGITLTSTSGVVAGTASIATTGTFTVRATDSGGNYVDRAFTMPNSTPVWSTTTLPNVDWNVSYSTTLSAPDDSGNTPTFSLISGSLPAGISLNTSSGVISGTSTSSNTYSLTFRATDVNGGYVDRSLSLTVNPRYVQVLLIAGGGSGGNGASNGSNCSGGGGAGGVLFGSTVGVTSGTGYGITIGGGGSAYGVSSSQDGYDGSATQGFGLTAVGGGHGGGAQSGAGGNGGSGGGGGEGQPGGTGTAGQGNNGGSGNFGGGGGAGGAGGSWNTNGNANGGSATSDYSTWSAATGTGVGGQYAGGGGGGSGGGGQSILNGGGGGATAGATSGNDTSNATANTGSGSGAAGTGGAPNTTGSGGSGLCIVRYAGSQAGSGGSIVTTGGYTYHTFTSNGTFTA
jgi:hypothetical protein